MKKILFLSSTIFIVNLFAFDIDSAIKLSLQNNNLIKENQTIVKENQEVLNGSKSVYMPKVDLKYTYDNKFKPHQGENKNDSTLNLDLTYNLFNGFKDENMIKSKYNNLQISEYQYRTILLDIALQTKQEYIAYLKAQKNTYVQEKALKLFQKQYEDAKNFYDNGVNITLNNLLEVEISLLESQKLLKEAISNEKIAKQKLFTTIGKKVDETIEDIPLQEQEYLTVETTAKTLGLLSLIEYQDSLKNEQKVIKGNYYPKVDATLQHKRYGDSVALNGIDGTSEPQNIALVELSWNLFNGQKDKSDIVAHKHKINQVNYQIQKYKDDLELQYMEAKEKLYLEKENLKISKKTFQQAKVNYNIVHNSFKEGIISSKDLIDANYLLSKSESTYHDTYYNNLLAIAELERLLEKGNKND